MSEPTLPDRDAVEKALDQLIEDAALVEYHAVKAVLAAAHSLAGGNDVGVRYDGTVKYWRDQRDSARRSVMELIYGENAS